MKVGTATIPAIAEILFTTSFWLTLTSDRFAWSTLVEQLPLRLHLLVHPAGVVGDIAEEAAQFLRDALEAALLQHLEWAEQGPDRPVELDHLPLQVVDAGGRGRDVVVEDVLLDLLDVVLDRVDHRDVVVDDLVEHGPDRRRGPELDQVWA